MAAGEVPGLWGLGKSYMSLDTDGRVVRLDSFAKFLAPGFRLGWLTAHPHFVDKFTFHMHGTALGPCSTTQVNHHSYTHHTRNANNTDVIVTVQLMLGQAHRYTQCGLSQAFRLVAVESGFWAAVVVGFWVAAVDVGSGLAVDRLL